jgi:hypothetical protein
MLYRATTKTLVTAAVITTLTLAVATPASAATQRNCGSVGTVIGDVTSQGAVTYETWGDCGTVGVRARYVHVGGVSWTSWRSGASGVNVIVKNANLGQHRTSKPAISFSTTR